MPEKRASMARWDEFVRALLARKMLKKAACCTVVAVSLADRWSIPKTLQAPHQRNQVEAALAELIKDGIEPSPGRVMAALPFSSWTAMFSPAYESLWRASLNEIAATPEGRRLSREQLSRRLTPIRLLRNRVAHHEPILHWDLRKHHTAMSEVMQ